MNRAVSITLAVLLAIAVTFAIREHWEVNERDASLASLRRDLDVARKQAEEAAAAAKAARDAADAAQENIARLTRERNDAKKTVDAAPAAGVAPIAAADAPKAEGGNPMAGFAKMFEGEEGKKMMKMQMETVTRMQYGDLAKALKLSPTDAANVMSLLTDRQAALAEGSFKMMGSGFDEATMKEIGEKSNAINAEYDEKLKAVLGEQGFQEMKDFDKTIGDRMMMVQYDQSFSAAGVPLQSDQREKLLQIMATERKATPEAPFDQTGRDPLKGMNAIQDDAAIEKWLAQEKDYQQRVLKAAPGALTPDQVNALQQGLNSQLEMQKFGIKMGQQMMKGGEKGGVTVPAPVIIQKQ